MEKYPKVYIVIVNWNGWKDTVECVESLQSITYPNYEILIVDNNSPGDDVKILTKKFSKYRNVSIIANPKNLGYTGGCNVGIKKALERGDCDYVLILNNDTLVTEDFLEKMVLVDQYNRTKKGKPCLVGCKILYYPEKDKVWYIGTKISFYGDIIAPLRGKIDNKSLKGIVDTEIISGCAMLIPKEILLDVGLFDDRYFFGIDDIEYSYRVRLHGYDVKVNLDAVIYHKAGESVKDKGPLQAYYIVRNQILFRRTYFSVFPLYKNILWICFFTTKYLISIIVNLLRKNKRYLGVIYGIIDALRGEYGECKNEKILNLRSRGYR